MYVNVKMSKNLFIHTHFAVVAGRQRRTTQLSQNCITIYTPVKWWQLTKGLKCRLKEPFRW